MVRRARSWPHRVAQEASRLRWVRSFCCGGLLKKISLSPSDRPTTAPISATNSPAQLPWDKRTQRGGGDCRTPPPQIGIGILKQHRFCRQDDGNGFTWLSLHPKSATEIGWSLVHWNFEKHNKQLRESPMTLKNENLALWFKVSQSSEHVVIFICTYMQLQSVMLQLYLWHHFYNINFKTENKLYT